LPGSGANRLMACIRPLLDPSADKPNIGKKTSMV
jgi:hypothetical protein